MFGGSDRETGDVYNSIEKLCDPAAKDVAMMKPWQLIYPILNSLSLWDNPRVIPVSSLEILIFRNSPLVDIENLLKQSESVIFNTSTNTLHEIEAHDLISFGNHGEWSVRMFSENKIVAIVRDRLNIPVMRVLKVDKAQGKLKRDDLFDEDLYLN